MSEQFREDIKHRLYDLKDEFEREIKRIEELGLRESLKDVTGELSSYDNHSSDLGSETFERGKDIALRDRQRILLQKVTDALDKLEKAPTDIVRTVKKLLKKKDLRQCLILLCALNVKKR